MRTPRFVFGFVPRVVALVSILVVAGCGGGGGGNQDSGAGGHSGTGGSTGTGGHTATGGSSGTGGAVTDSGTDLPKADAGSGGATGTGGQMDAGMDTPNGTGGAGMGGAGMGGAGGEDAGGDAAADSGTDGVADGSTDVPPTSATGVEMISVPLTAPEGGAAVPGQRYNVQNRVSPDVPYNLAGQTLTIRAYAPGAIGGDLSVFFRSSIPVDGAATGAVDSVATKVALSTLTSGFTDVPITVPAAAGGFDPSMVDIMRIEVEAAPAFGDTFQTPATIIYFDSITSSNGAVNLTFDVAAGGNDFASSGARPLAGSTQPAFLATFP